MATKENLDALAKLVGVKAAKQLTAQFDDLAAALDADDGLVPAPVKDKLAAIRTLINAMTEGPLRQRDCLTSFRQVVDYLRVRLTH